MPADAGRIRDIPGATRQSAAAPGEFDLEDRQALRRVAGLSTELEDVTEVEYRSLRLEQVVLIGVWAEGSLASAENSLPGAEPRSPRRRARRFSRA